MYYSMKGLRSLYQEHFDDRHAKRKYETCNGTRVAMIDWQNNYRISCVMDEPRKEKDSKSMC